MSSTSSSVAAGERVEQRGRGRAGRAGAVAEQRGLAQAERGEHGGGRAAAVGDRRQLDQPDAVGRLGARRRARGLAGQPGLAGAAGPERA